MYTNLYRYYNIIPQNTKTGQNIDILLNILYIMNIHTTAPKGLFFKPIKKEV